MKNIVKGTEEYKRAQIVANQLENAAKQVVESRESLGFFEVNQHDMNWANEVVSTVLTKDEGFAKQVAETVCKSGRNFRCSSKQAWVIACAFIQIVDAEAEAKRAARFADFEDETEEAEASEVSSPASEAPKAGKTYTATKRYAAAKAAGKSFKGLKKFVAKKRAEKRAATYTRKEAKVATLTAKVAELYAAYEVAANDAYDTFLQRQGTLDAIKMQIMNAERAKFMLNCWLDSNERYAVAM